MKRRTLVITAAVVLLSLGATRDYSSRRSNSNRDPSSGRMSSSSTRPSSSSTSRPARTAGYSERYGLLEERNIFLRDRAHRPTTRDSSSTQPATAKRPMEESFVLAGVVLEDAGYRAYVENPVQGETLRLAPGDPLAHGKVGSLAIDGFSYDTPDGQHTWVEIGCDLTGRPSMLLAASSAGGGAAPTTGPVISSEVANLNPNDPNLTLEQKMKLKRALELQKKP